jgi:hypothetical protein
MGCSQSAEVATNVAGPSSSKSGPTKTTVANTNPIERSQATGGYKSNGNGPVIKGTYLS